MIVIPRAPIGAKKAHIERHGVLVLPFVLMIVIARIDCMLFAKAEWK